jgi:hypothetical protein
MKTTTLIMFLASTASIGFIGWRVHAMHNQTVNHFAVVGDASLSYTGGCASVVGLAEQDFHAERLAPIHPDSTYDRRR